MPHLLTTTRGSALTPLLQADALFAATTLALLVSPHCPWWLVGYLAGLTGAMGLFTAGAWLWFRRHAPELLGRVVTRTVVGDDGAGVA